MKLFCLKYYDLSAYLVLSYYLDSSIPDSIINSTAEYLHPNKINDFVFIKYYFSLLKSKFNQNMLKDLLFVTPKSLYKKNQLFNIRNKCCILWNC